MSRESISLTNSTYEAPIRYFIYVYAAVVQLMEYLDAPDCANEVLFITRLIDLCILYTCRIWRFYTSQ